MTITAEQLRVNIIKAKASGDADQMKAALDQCAGFLDVGMAVAMERGTRKERAERVFDELGFDTLAASVKDSTASFICQYLWERMEADGRDRPTAIYYDDAANHMNVDVSVIKKMWTAYRETFHAGVPRVLGVSPEEILKLARHCYDNEGQRLSGK